MSLCLQLTYHRNTFHILSSVITTPETRVFQEMTLVNRSRILHLLWKKEIYFHSLKNPPTGTYPESIKPSPHSLSIISILILSPYVILDLPSIVFFTSLLLLWFCYVPRGNNINENKSKFLSIIIIVKWQWQLFMIKYFPLSYPAKRCVRDMRGNTDFNGRDCYYKEWDLLQILQEFTYMPEICCKFTYEVMTLLVTCKKNVNYYQGVHKLLYCSSSVESRGH
jgi:hypothetical protein